jgi:hypothetical protein
MSLVANISVDPIAPDLSLWDEFLKGADASELATSRDPTECGSCIFDLAVVFHEARDALRLFVTIERALLAGPSRLLDGHFPTLRLDKGTLQQLCDSYFAPRVDVVRAHLHRGHALAPAARRAAVEESAREVNLREREVARHLKNLWRFCYAAAGRPGGWDAGGDFGDEVLRSQFRLGSRRLRWRWLSLLFLARYRVLCGGPGAAAKRLCSVRDERLVECASIVLAQLVPGMRSEQPPGTLGPPPVAPAPGQSPESDERPVIITDGAPAPAWQGGALIAAADEAELAAAHAREQEHLELRRAAEQAERDSTETAEPLTSPTAALPLARQAAALGFGFDRELVFVLRDVLARLARPRQDRTDVLSRSTTILSPAALERVTVARFAALVRAVITLATSVVSGSDEKSATSGMSDFFGCVVRISDALLRPEAPSATPLLSRAEVEEAMSAIANSVPKSQWVRFCGVVCFLVLRIGE